MRHDPDDLSAITQAVFVVKRGPAQMGSRLHAPRVPGLDCAPAHDDTARRILGHLDAHRSGDLRARPTGSERRLRCGRPRVPWCRCRGRARGARRWRPWWRCTRACVAGLPRTGPGRGTRRARAAGVVEGQGAAEVDGPFDGAEGLLGSQAEVLGAFDGAGEDLVLRRDLVERPEGESLCRGEGPAFENGEQGLLGSDEAGQPLGAPAAGREAEQDLGKADDVVAVSHDPQVAGEGQLRADGEGGAFECCDDDGARWRSSSGTWRGSCRAAGGS